MSVNKVILVGNVCKDPDVKHLESSSVANFSLATNERGYTTKSGKEVPERVEFHNVVVWGGLVKVVEGYVKKGTQIYIDGKIRTRSWDDKDGNKRYTTEVYAENIQLLGGRSQQSEQPQQSQQPQQTQQTHSNDDPGDGLPF